MHRIYLKTLPYFFNNHADTPFIGNIRVRLEELVGEIYDVSSDNRQNALFTDISNIKTYSQYNLVKVFNLTSKALIQDVLSV